MLGLTIEENQVILERDGLRNKLQQGGYYGK